MMTIRRPMIKGAGGLELISYRGYGNLFSPDDSQVLAADANSVISAAALAGGLIQRTVATAARTDTSDTGANLDAVFSNADIGDIFVATYANLTAQTITIAGGVGVTASGNLAVTANKASEVMFKRTGIGTWNMVGLG